MLLLELQRRERAWTDCRRLFTVRPWLTQSLEGRPLRGEIMKKLSAAAAFLLGMASLVRAQNQVSTAIANADAAVESAQMGRSVQPVTTLPRQVAPFYGTWSGP